MTLPCWAWGRVIAGRRIEQSPLDDAPPVPKGSVGSVEDEADDLLWVDFGEPYGVVACEVAELVFGNQVT